MTFMLRHILFGSTALALLAAPVLAQIVKGASHPDAAKTWLDFIRSPEALQIFARYGFKATIAH